MKKKISLLLLFFIAVFAPFAGASTQSALAAEDCTVTFWLEDGVQYDEQTVVSGGYVDIPATPEPIKNGSYFPYWECEGTKFSFATKIMQDTQLYAKWENVATFYTVDFVVEGRTVSTQVVEEGSAAIAPTLFECPEGMEFDRWDSSFHSVTRDMTVTAVLKASEYLVEFIGFNGEVVSTERVVHGGTATAPAVVPDVPYHTFSGIDGELTNITQNVQFKLLYTPEIYTVTYLLENGDEFTEAKQVAYGGYAPFPVTTPQKENHVFLGWYIGDAPYDFNTPLQGNVQLNAKFLSVRHQVRFYTHDGVQYGGAQWVFTGESAIAPGAPAREGYTFLRWTEDFNEVTQDLEVYPVYEINRYTVNVVALSGEVIYSSEVTYGGSVQEPPLSVVPAVEGMEFVCFEGSFRNVKEDVTITLKYRVKTFTVMFYQDMQKVGVTQYVEYGKPASVPQLEERVGYEFKGWSNGQSTDGYLSIQEDSVFFAVYEKLVYTVEYYDGQTLLYAESVEHGGFAPLRDYTQDGMIFVGWFGESELTNAYSFADGVTGNLKLYAKLEEEPETVFTVRFEADGKPYSEQLVKENGSALLPPTPTKTGYTFIRWEGSYVNVTQDVTLTAVFEINVYTVTFIYGDNQQDIQQIEYLSSATAPTDTDKVGYTFLNWDADYSKVSGNLTVKALYSKEIYSVNFYDGANRVDAQKIEYEGTPLLPATPSKAGHVFLGWFLDEDGNESFQFTAPISGHVNVYAKFRANEHTVEYYLDGVLYETQTFAFGETITPLEAPVFGDANKQFLGWVGIPSTMPDYTVTVMGSTYTKQYYNVIYYVAGQEYQTVPVLEGEPILPLNAPTNLPENIEFKEWGKMPETMPTHDVVVNAKVTVKNYYTLTFYIDGRQYAVLRAIEGGQVTPPEVAEGYSDRFVFVGWDIEVPEEMPAQNLVFHAQLRWYRTAYFYADGMLYTSERFLQGDEVVAPTVPQGYSNKFVVVGWEEYPQKMPDNDIGINAIVRRYYTLSYVINGTVFTNQRLLEGDAVNLIAIPEGYSEQFEIIGWKAETLTQMPSRDVNVHADIRFYYVITYTVNGEVVHTERLLEGVDVPTVGALENLPEHIVFEGWEQIYTTMPSFNVTVRANIRTLNYYEVVYYIDGAEYTRTQILEGKPIEHPEVPENYNSEFVIDGWTNAPSTMPQNNVEIHASIRRYYTITYVLDGVTVDTVTLLEGETVTPYAPPALLDGELFSGWQDEPTTMPAQHVTVTGSITSNRVNDMSLSVAEEDGIVTISLWVRGDVNFAGVTGTVSFGNDFILVDSAYDGNYAFIHQQGAQLNFVLAVGENLRSEVHIFTARIRYVGGGDVNQIELNIAEVKAYNEFGEIVNAEFRNDN